MTDTPTSFEKIYDRALSSLHAWTGPIRSQMIGSIDHIVSYEGIRSIIALPVYASTFLDRVYQVHNEDIVRSVKVGMLGWAAWSHADMIRDGDESADPMMISVFSALQCAFFDALRASHIPLRIQSRISAILTSMECANYEESVGTLTHTPAARSDGGAMSMRARMSAKSMGAAIPLLILLSRSSVSDADLDHCLGFFEGFLSARQLSDDALDWHEDYLYGTRTLIVQWLIDACGDMVTIERMRRAFENTVRYRAVDEMRRRALRALGHARAMTCFVDYGFLERLIRPYMRHPEQSVQSLLLPEYKAILTCSDEGPGSGMRLDFLQDDSVTVYSEGRTERDGGDLGRVGADDLDCER